MLLGVEIERDEDGGEVESVVHGPLDVVYEQPHHFQHGRHAGAVVEQRAADVWRRNTRVKSGVCGGVALHD